MRLMGGLQAVELSIMDVFFQLKPSEDLDERIVIVGWEESDIYHFQRSRPSDLMLAETIDKLEKGQPVVIGIDFLRDIPEPPGRKAFLDIFTKYDQVFAAAKITGSQKNNQFAPLPPPPIPESAIADVSAILDGDGIKRRSFLYAQTDPPVPNLAWVMAKKYLARQNIFPSEQSKWLRLNGITFYPVKKWHSPYIRVDDRGYQIIPNWRKSEFIKYSFAEVLNPDFDPTLVTEKIVLLGATAPSLKDITYLPFNLNLEGSPQFVPGVVSHAQTASFILSATLNGRPTIQFLQEPWISLMIIVSGLIGASLLQCPLMRRVLLILGGSVLLVFSSYGLFLKGWWVPIVPSLVTLLGNCLILSVVQYEQNQKRQLEKISQINAKLENRVEKSKIYQEFAAFCSHISKNLLDDYQFLINFKTIYQKLIKAVFLEMETLIEDKSVYRKLENSLNLIQQVTVNEADEKIKLFGAFLSRSLPGMDIASFDIEGLDMTKSNQTLEQLIPEIVLGNLRQIFYDLYDWDSKTQCYFQLDEWSISLDSKLLLKFLHKMIDEVLDIADSHEANEKVKIFFQSYKEDKNKILKIQITYPYHPQEITALEWSVYNYQVKVKTDEDVTIWTILM
ncbi:MAG: CHASE2 domain-containing protein [Crocosphaera sp.]|nr:CHASE2 domain-containing protein [Crocosphaera sp.]MDJ0583235.1 CHASE2 domain-containing protein [Crocosphaera sp.]